MDLPRAGVVKGLQGIIWSYSISLVHTLQSGEFIGESGAEYNIRSTGIVQILFIPGFQLFPSR